jgi:hypothetical protein
MATYSCRLCRVSLAASKGCAVCDAVRPHIVVAESEDVSLAEVSRETVKALQEQLRAYKEVLRDCQVKEREGWRESVRSVASTLSKVLDAARKLQEDGVKAVELMSTREKMDLFEAYYVQLPPAVRVRFMAQLQAADEALGSENAGWKDLASALNGN